MSTWQIIASVWATVALIAWFCVWCGACHDRKYGVTNE